MKKQMSLEVSTQMQGDDVGSKSRWVALDKMLGSGIWCLQPG